jgi:hypothetical protein
MTTPQTITGFNTAILENHPRGCKVAADQQRWLPAFAARAASEQAHAARNRAVGNGVTARDVAAQLRYVAVPLATFVGLADTGGTA